LTSNAHPGPTGTGPAVASIGWIRRPAGRDRGGARSAISAVSATAPRSDQTTTRQRISAVYQPFAAAQGLPRAELPYRPRPHELIARTIAEEAATLRHKLHESGAVHVVTLGQEAADAFAAIFATERVLLRPDQTYGHHRPVIIANRRIDWLPMTHPGNRTPAWRARHTRWTTTASL
jgi:hypothetical protein